MSSSYYELRNVVFIIFFQIFCLLFTVDWNIDVYYLKKEKNIFYCNIHVIWISKHVNTNVKLKLWKTLIWKREWRCEERMKKRKYWDCAKFDMHSFCVSWTNLLFDLKLRLHHHTTTCFTWFYITFIAKVLHSLFHTRWREKKEKKRNPISVFNLRDEKYSMRFFQSNLK